MGDRLVRPIMPHMRFLFVGPRFCLRLPSDSTSRWTPLPLANSSHCNACSGLTPPSLCACRAHPSSTGFAGAPSEREPLKEQNKIQGQRSSTRLRLGAKRFAQNEKTSFWLPAYRRGSLLKSKAKPDDSRLRLGGRSDGRALNPRLSFPRPKEISVYRQ